MGVFSLGPALALYEAAAIAAAHDLGVFSRGVGEPTGGTQRGHRMHALLAALAACGVVERIDEPADRDDPGYRVRRIPPRPDVPAEGWGRLAEVVRTDRPLPIDDVAPYHAHLVRAGAPVARELAARWGRQWGQTQPALLDLGAGAGAYTEAWLDAWPEGRATVVDAPEVIALARAHLGRFGERVAFVAGDAREVEFPAHDVVILANVLHLHGAEASVALVAAAARAVVPGGRVVIVDLDAASPEGVWFALDMALYTDAGTVHATAAIRGWLERAGLAVDEGRVEAADEVVVVTGTRGVD